MADLLIVDDEPDSLDSLAELMRIDGHEVRIAYNGEEGLGRLGERRPDLVLLDVEMPVLSGPQMALRMFVHDVGMEEIPIVLISGVANLAQVADGVGTPYRLAKPYRYEALAALVARALVERIPPKPAAVAAGQ